MRVSLIMIASSVLLPVITLTALAANPAPPVSGKQSGQAAATSGKSMDKPAPLSLVSFRESVEPYIKAHCTECHNPGAPASGLNLEAHDALFKGGSKWGAKVVVPGNATASAIVAYIKGQKQPRMPLNHEAVPDAQIKLIETWINQGAKIDEVKLGWPYTPVVMPAVPKVKDTAWVKNPVDAFVLAKLEAKGLKPSPPASKTALLRRVYADLVGMPPTPTEAGAFLNDASPNAYEKLVDKLLADSRYGERWGRHWLDLVRYADSDGFEQDGARPRAWRFRDYVIRSFNQDKPYDRFLKEQIAGDELYPNDADAITATGYIRLAPWDALSTDPPQRRQDFLNDATDTTGSVMLGLTVGCARCHNHKYDPITQADYYRMQAFFTPAQKVDTRLPDNTGDPATLTPKLRDAQTHLEAVRKQMNDLRNTHRALLLAAKQAKLPPGAKVEVSNEEIETSIRKTKEREWEDLRREEDRWWDITQPLEPIADAITDDRNPKPTHLLLRGNLLTPGPEVQPGFVASLTGVEEKPAAITPPAKRDTTGRRSALANWIASPDNPMTARVMVNRLWQHHFGRGIVATPSDFGKNGDKPTHPELLDWLAGRFVGRDEGGGMRDEKSLASSLIPHPSSFSLKTMHRLMLLSNTYQQSTQINPQGQKLDSTNKWFWRMNRIRLEGEALRDSILTVSGRLNPAASGPGVFPHVSDEVLSTGSTHKWGNSSEEEGRRRTVYVFQRRSLALPIVEAFDGPDMVNTCPRRATTTIAPQALALFNGEFSRGEAGFFAVRVARDAGDDITKQIARAYEIALLRRPTLPQQTLAQEFLARQTRLHLNDAQNGKPSGVRPVAVTAANTPDAKTLKAAQQAALTDLCHVLLNTNEFLYLD